MYLFATLYLFCNFVPFSQLCPFLQLCTFFLLLYIFLITLHLHHPTLHLLYDPPNFGFLLHTPLEKCEEHEKIRNIVKCPISKEFSWSLKRLLIFIITPLQPLKGCLSDLRKAKNYKCKIVSIAALFVLSLLCNRYLR